MMLRRVAVLEVIERAGALRGDRLAGVVCGRAHRAAAGAARDIACAGKLDGHAGTMSQRWGASQIALPCNAYCVCTPTAPPGRWCRTRCAVVSRERQGKPV